MLDQDSYGETLTSPQPSTYKTSKAASSNATSATTKIDTSDMAPGALGSGTVFSPLATTTPKMTVPNAVDGREFFKKARSILPYDKVIPNFGLVVHEVTL